MIILEKLMNLAKSLSNISYTSIMYNKYLDYMINDGNIEYAPNNDDSNSVKILNINKS